MRSDVIDNNGNQTLLHHGDCLPGGERPGCGSKELLVVLLSRFGVEAADPAAQRRRHTQHPLQQPPSNHFYLLFNASVTSSLLEIRKDFLFVSSGSLVALKAAVFHTESWCEM